MPRDDARANAANGADGEPAAAGRPLRPPIGRLSDALPTAIPPLPLAHGDLTDDESAELRALKQQIEEIAGFFCGSYKEKCLRRRIAVRMRARGVHSYAAYAALLSEDVAEYERLVDTLTINVSKFFRNPDVWDVVSRAVLPELFSRPEPELRVWSAGTASGEEAYTLRMLAVEHAEGHRGDADRVQILGTDIDRLSIAAAERAEYAEFSMSDTSPEARDRWFRFDGSYRLVPDAKRNVRFEALDLIRDPFPARQHLIVCRNVIIYFERAVQEVLFRRFHDALVPGGFLVLGKVEALFGAEATLFQPVAHRQRVFRRV
jgi:chemotaxis protein methyltransferase CheR